MANLIHRIRSWPSATAVLALVLAACAAPANPSGLVEYPGWALVVKFDGVRLGVGGSSTYPRTACAYDSLSAPPILITREDRWCCGPDVKHDWMVPESGGTLASMRLEFMPGGDPSAGVEFSVGEAVYRSDASTVIHAEPAEYKTSDDMLYWAGTITFEDVLLASGPPYEGRQTIGRLVIKWNCRTD